MEYTANSDTYLTINEEETHVSEAVTHGSVNTGDIIYIGLIVSILITIFIVLLVGIFVSSKNSKSSK